MYIQSIIPSVLSLMVIIIPSSDGCVARNLSYYVIPVSQLTTTDLDNYYKEKVSHRTLKEYQELGNFSECDYRSNKILPISL